MAETKEKIMRGCISKSIAAAILDYPIPLQWTGGLGHHAFSNIIIVGGSGFGPAHDVWESLLAISPSLSWSPTHVFRWLPLCQPRNGSEGDLHKFLSYGPHRRGVWCRRQRLGDLVL
jgi:hypothetical protein